MGSVFCKLCEVEDFADPALRSLIRSAFANHAERHGPAFPSGREYRKFWEVAISLRAFSELGILGETSELLGVGAGAEATIFWLTNHARRVFATDLYLGGEEWGEQAPPAMLRDPAPYAPCHWNPRRLVVQQSWEMIDRQVETLVRLVDDLLDVSRINRGKINLQKQPVDVATIVARAVESSRPLIDALSTEYRLEGKGPGLPGTLMFSEDELRSVLADGAAWELVEPLDLGISRMTRRTVVDLDEATADIRAGRDWTTYPHIVLRHSSGVRWTSVHVALRRLG